MSTEQTPDAESIGTIVYDTAVRLLQERELQEGMLETEAWVTGSEIASRTELDKDVVVSALRALGRGRLHVRAAADVGDEIEVLGVDHTHEH